MRQYKNLKYSSNFKFCKGFATNKSLEVIEFHPETIRIEGHAFRNDLNIKQVFIHSNIALAADAFFRLPNLQEIEINNKIVPEGLMELCGFMDKISEPDYEGVNIILKNTIKIEEYSFMHNKIKSINFPKTLKKICECAFYESYFVDPVLIIPDGVEEIDDFVFDETNLTDVYIPDSIKHFGVIENCKTVFHMSKETFDKLHISEDVKVEFGKTLNELIDEYGFKQVNLMNLEKENKENSIIK